LDTSSNGVFVQTCGNGHTDAGELCDDGNTSDGDGCSGRCRVEQYLDADEQKCVNADNVAGAAVAKAELADDLRCFKAGAAGNEPDPQGCAAADANHKVERAQSKLTAKDTALCASVAPPFAHTSPSTASAAAANEARALITDLFGSNFDMAQIKTAVDPVGAACQKEVLIASQNLLKQYVASFLSCKKKRFAGKLWPTIGSAVDLEDCWDEPDTKSLSRASDRLNGAASGVCYPVNVNNAFPNGQANPIQGAYFQVRCRACRMFNRMDGLNRDCDAFDFGSVGSCAN
jgi:cysteine-rich repeat protein